MHLYVINSAIGGGKTELTKVIREFLPEVSGKKVIIIDEPVDLVSNVGGENLLAKFYADMPRWSFTIQFFFFITRVMNARKVMAQHGDAIYIMERDLVADKKCFAETLHEDGKMTPAEWFTYEECFNFLNSSKEVPKIDGYIFVDCSLETHMARILSRGRPGEIPDEKGSGVGKDYEARLIMKHRELEEDLKKTGAKMLILDGEKNFKDDPVVKNEIVEMIRNFVLPCV